MPEINDSDICGVRAREEWSRFGIREPSARLGHGVLATEERRNRGMCGGGFELDG